MPVGHDGDGVYVLQLRRLAKINDHPPETRRLTRSRNRSCTWARGGGGGVARAEGDEKKTAKRLIKPGLSRAGGSLWFSQEINPVQRQPGERVRRLGRTNSVVD